MSRMSRWGRRANTPSLDRGLPGRWSGATITPTGWMLLRQSPKPPRFAYGSTVAARRRAQKNQELSVLEKGRPYFPRRVGPTISQLISAATISATTISSVITTNVSIAAIMIALP